MNTTKVFDFNQRKVKLFKQTLKTKDQMRIEENSDSAMQIEDNPYPQDIRTQDRSPFSKPYILDKAESHYTPAAKLPLYSSSEPRMNTIFRNIRQEAYEAIKSSQENLYQILNIDPFAGEKDVARAYKRMCLQYHPDKRPGFEQEFMRVSKAYKILSNPELRKVYDEQGYQAAMLYFESYSTFC